MKKSPWIALVESRDKLFLSFHAKVPTVKSPSGCANAPLTCKYKDYETKQTPNRIQKHIRISIQKERMTLKGNKSLAVRAVWGNGTLGNIKKSTQSRSQLRPSIYIFTNESVITIAIWWCSLSTLNNNSENTLIREPTDPATYKEKAYKNVQGDSYLHPLLYLWRSITTPTHPNILWHTDISFIQEYEMRYDTYEWYMKSHNSYVWKQAYAVQWLQP